MTVATDSKNDLNEALSRWEELGYKSKSDAMKDAAALWRAFVEHGYIKTPDQCKSIIKSPKVWAMGRFIL